MDYVRYLQAKSTVDARAFNYAVLNDFEDYLRQTASIRRSSTNAPLRVIEVGAGVGIMFQRLLERDVTFSTASTHYTVIDIKPEVVKAAQELIKSKLTIKNDDILAGQVSLPVQSPTVTGSSGVHHYSSCDESLRNLGEVSVTESLTISFLVGDALEYVRSNKARFDVIIAAAVLDLWQLEEAVESLLGALDVNGGVCAFYFPINFDGTTSFFPESCEGSTYDKNVEDEYHAAMGHHLVSGSEVQTCYTGRSLIPVLNKENIELTSYGSSSWIVKPNSDGTYECDERYFLNCILDFIEATLEDSGISGPEFDSGAFSRYMACRREQIANGQLYFLAHNIDLCGHLKLR